jgi:hypothetical protein
LVVTANPDDSQRYIGGAKTEDSLVADTVLLRVLRGVFAQSLVQMVHEVHPGYTSTQICNLSRVSSFSSLSFFYQFLHTLLSK